MNKRGRGREKTVTPKILLFFVDIFSLERLG
jgi:hypothetical protein